ncbi:MAG: glycosyltransferase [Balneolaceae bacterium]|nr:glycosyltransferase [Balneolaceae bacterium]
MILSIAWVVFITYALLGVFIISGLFRIPRTKAVSEPLPTVSLLISCRNEEKDIDDCLRSLAQLTYPKDKLQIILVDDYSTDATPAKLKAFADQYDHAAFYSGEEFPETHLEAKGRGIARAASKASGDWLFITDADAVVPPHWIEHMLYGTHDDSGLIVGTTETINKTFLATLEKIAGIYTIPVGWGLAGWGIPINGLGPNMAIRRKFYEQYGGLEAANFRIAEDHALFNMIKKNGHDIHHQMDENIQIKLKPVKTYAQIISQQRRWIKGGFEGSILERVLIASLLFFAMTFSLFFLYVVIAFPTYGLIFGSIKFVTDSIAYGVLSAKTRSKGLLWLIPLTFIYTIVSFIWLPLSFLFKRDIAWMGDGYEVTYK